MLLRRLRLTAEQSYVCTCPLVLKYAYQLDGLDSALFYPPHAPAYPAWLDREGAHVGADPSADVLLFYPYHSMQPFLDLLRQSAADPAVVSIQMTIYRVAGEVRRHQAPVRRGRERQGRDGAGGAAGPL